MKFTVDRKEEGFLVVVNQNKECLNIDAKLCPGAKEGDIISIEVLEKETNEAKKAIEEKLERLKKR